MQLTKNEVKVQHPYIYEIFWEDKAIFVKEPRKETESLHEYLTRKQIKCFCSICKHIMI